MSAQDNLSADRTDRTQDSGGWYVASDGSKFRVKNDGPCAVDTCERLAHARGWCAPHWRAWNKYGDPLGKSERGRKTCGIDGCTKLSRARGLCGVHYSKRLRENNDYIVLFRPSHPNASKRGYIGEHVLVMSEHLNRPLLPGETVHHRNGQRYLNDIDNLELWVTHQPRGQRPSDLLSWAYEIIDRYEGKL